ncbi:MAG: DNA polymerase I [Candidatus Cloacimonetes bacterium]|jgi:DNA polymerase-1|nr:DNA polymerase I [Candidatus Cloacimonadota bacterium]
MRKKLYLIDGTAFIYRAFFAFIRNPLYNSKGQNTSAIFGTINSFIKLVEDFKPEHIAVSFDRREKTFRHEITDTYKANRPPAPDELHQQVEPIREFFAAIGLHDISLAGYEADDVIATLAEKYKNKFDIVIVSGDKDFAQLVEEKVTLYDPKKNQSMNAESIKAKYGISPNQFIDYLAICGDSADNIPGVKGIGPKGASKLLNEFETLDGIYENLDKINAKGILEKLTGQKEDAYLSRKLVTIIRDVPIEIPDEELSFDKIKLQDGIDILNDFELSSIAKKIKKLFSQPKTEPGTKEVLSFEHEFNFNKDETDLKYQTILTDTKESFAQLLSSLDMAEIVAVDTETTSKDTHLAELVGISICADVSRSHYIPLKHQMAQNLDAEEVLTQLKDKLKGKILIAHNSKYDLLVLENADWKIEENIFDTMIAHYLINPTSRHSLANCALDELGHEMIPISELIGKGKKQITFDLVPTDQAAKYAAEDAYVTFKLYKSYLEKLKKNELYELFQTIELPLIFVLADMEKNGVYIDREILAEFSKRNQKKLGKLTKDIFEIAGSQFNLNSPQQLSKVLFEDLGIKAEKKIKTGYSTNITVLESLAKDHKIARFLIEYRQISKLESTYVSALPELINPKSGRVHSSFNQTVASTGRLSSSNPNMQNIPIRTEMGREIRKAFCASDNDHVILAADYSQIELRILAVLSGDDKMIDAFNNKQDIHRETACIIFDVSKDEVTHDQRRYAKIINFGLMYGMGSFRISQELDISRQEAKEFIENYFNKFPTIKEYLHSGIQQATIDGYVSTIYGRKLYLPDLYSSNKMLSEGAKRVATNMPIQGSAADIIKVAMISLHKKIKNNSDIKMIIQVHDELVFEVRKNKLEEAKKLIIEEMEKAVPEKYRNIVPLIVDVGIGDNWFEAH